MDVSAGTSRTEISFKSKDLPEQEGEASIVGYTNTEQHRLKRFLYLPFDPVWEISLLMLGVINILLLMYEFATVRSSKEFAVESSVRVFNRLLDVLYITDNLLIVACRFSHGLCIPFLNIKRPIWLILIDMATCIPVTEALGNTFFEFMTLYEFIDFLKFIRITYYFHYHSQTIHDNTLKYPIFFILFSTFVFSLFLLCCIQVINCISSSKCDFTTLAFDVSHSATILTFRGVAGVHGNLYFLFAAMTFAFLAWFDVTVQRISLLITSFICNKAFENSFRLKLRSTIAQMHNLNISKDLHKKAVAYIRLDWNHRGEYHQLEVSECIDNLPDALQSELCTEVFWPALMHSQLFRKMDLPFLRCISRQMRKVHIFPGEIIYEKNSYKHQMIYVASGVIQIVSEEDDGTPILSFSAGTCLGESTLISVYPSQVSVRCKDYGEIYVLKMADLLKASKKFPEQYQKLRNVILERYDTADKLRKITDILDEEYQVEQKTRDLTIMWLTSILHKLMMKGKSGSEAHQCQNVYLRDEMETERFNQRYFDGSFLNLLVITERISLIADSVFVKYKCPPVFQPDSIIRFIWDLFICFLTLLSCTLIPFYFAFFSYVPSWYQPLIGFITFFYCMDVYIVATTAISRRSYYISDIAAIVFYNLGCFPFWIDLFSAFPIELLKNVILRRYDDEFIVLLHLNRLLKLISVILLIGKFEKYTPRYAVIIRSLKNSIPYFFITYFVSCAVLRAETRLLSLSLKNFPEYLRYGFQIYTTIGFEQILEVANVTYLKYYFTVLLTLIMYAIIISKYAAERILAEDTEHKFRKIYVEIKSAADTFGVTNAYQRRMKYYITSQWEYDKALQFMDSTTTLRKLPFTVYQLLLEDATSKIVRDMPLFKNLPEDALFYLCSTVSFDLLPPREVICYRGSTQDCFYHIIEGYVEVLSTISNERQQVITANNTILIAEVYLNIPMTHTHVSLTHCKLLTFSLPLVRSILLKYLAETHITEKSLFNDIRERLVALDTRETLHADYNVDPENGSNNSFRNFGYNLKVDSPEEYEYFVPFDRCRPFSLIRVLLLRTTILPSGKFLFCWEIVRSIFAILSAVLFVINPVVTCWSCKFRWFLYFLDLIAWVDIYVRLHICYYDEKGILITHPLRTAWHYLSHGFIVDLLAAFPVSSLLSPRTARGYKLYTFLHAVRLLQLYRFLGLLKVIDTPYNFFYKFVCVIKYFPVLLVLCNFIASTACNFQCDFHEDIKSDLFEGGVKCKTDSSFLTSNYTTPLSKFDVHVISFMITMRWLTVSGTSVCNPRSEEDILITISAITFGFILHIFLLVNLVSKFSKEETVLLCYQKSLTALKRFLETERVTKIIQHKLVAHYELKWKKTKGHNLMKATKRLCRGLREDVSYCAFGNVLEEHSVFTHNSKVYFFRLMLLEAEYESITAGTTICFVNEIISKLYILYNGTVEVIAPDGTKLTVLHKGSLFGNLDDYCKVRQTVSVAAISDCEVLVIDALVFHGILSKFPQLRKHFKYLTVLHIDYLPGVTGQEEGSEGYNKPKSKYFFKMKLSFLRIWSVLLLVLVFSSTILQIYMQFLKEYNFVLLMFLYTCDALYILNFFISCLAAQDDAGEYTFFTTIRKHSSRLSVVLILLDSLPFDVILWIIISEANTRYRYIFWLRINRILRIRYYFQYFQQFRNNINISISSTKMLKLTILLSTALHTLTCILTSISCTDPPNFLRKIDCDPLQHTNKKHLQKLDLYFQHLYIVGTCFLLGTQYHYHPIRFKMFVYFSMIMLMSSFMFTTASAYVISILRADAFAIIAYQAKCRSLKNFTKSENVSDAMTNKVWDYVRCIWKAYKGPMLPEMLPQAPVTLKMKVMNQCYSQHIVNNPIFQKCHEDFLRQLVVTVKTNRYFPGDYITFKGDINGCMYFIHRGKVGVLLEDTDSAAAILRILKAGQAFGILQGLYADKPHEFFFKSINKTIIIELEITSWEYLLDYFPASKEIIYSVAKSYCSY